MQAINADRIINICFVIEREASPNRAVFCLPRERHGGLLDVPGDTGLLIKSSIEWPAIDSLTTSGAPNPMSTRCQNHRDRHSVLIVLDERGLMAPVDLLEGIELFVPRPSSPRVRRGRCSAGAQSLRRYEGRPVRLLRTGKSIRIRLEGRSSSSRCQEDRGEGESISDQSLLTASRVHEHDFSDDPWTPVPELAGSTRKVLAKDSGTYKSVTLALSFRSTTAS
jgi:hypothetical protein